MWAVHKMSIHSLFLVWTSFRGIESIIEVNYSVKHMTSALTVLSYINIDSMFKMCLTFVEAEKTAFQMTG